MASNLHLTLRVQPGNKVEITSPEFHEGDLLSILVSRSDIASPPVSAIELIEAYHSFSPRFDRREIDAYLSAERDAWQA